MISLLDAQTLRKPHLRLKGGVWSCASFYEEFSEGVMNYLTYWRIGFGYTPQQAYEDWRNQRAD